MNTLNIVQIVELEQMGYRHLRDIPTQGMCGTMPMLFTTALIVGLGDVGYSRRYCYEHAADAIAALEAWDGNGDPGGPWIKEKPSERRGPGAEKEAVTP